MTDFYSGQITDTINNGLRYNPEVRALSFALQQEKQRIIGLANRTRTAAMVDDLPEAVLDLLAVELRAPYYSEDMTIDQKRAVVKNTLLWFRKAGTPAAVEELVAAVFGIGDVVEWPDFTDPPFTPGTFDIVTDARMTPEIVARFLQIIQKVKNTRSHIRRVLTEREGGMEEFVAAGTISEPQLPIVNGGEHTAAAGQGRFTAKSGAASAPAEPVLNNPSAKQRAGQSAIFTAAALSSAPRENIVNNNAAKQRSAGGTPHVAIALAVRDQHITVFNCPPPPSTVRVEQAPTYAAAAVACSNISI